MINRNNPIAINPARCKFKSKSVRETTTDDILFKGSILKKTTLNRDPRFLRPISTLHVYTNITQYPIYVTHRNGVRSVVEYNETLARDRKGIYIMRLIGVKELYFC